MRGTAQDPAHAGSEVRTGKLPFAWLYLLIVAPLTAVLVFTALGVVARGDPTEYLARRGIDPGLVGFVGYIAGLVVAFLLLAWHLRHSERRWEDVGVRGRLTTGMVAFGLAGWFAGFCLFYVVNLLADRFGVPMFWGGETDFIRPDSGPAIALIVVGPVLIASIVEELLFRGYVLEAMLQRVRPVPAIALSALLFAVVHVAFGPGFVVYMFLIAAILGVLYFRFAAVWPCMVMHGVNNVVAYLVIPLLVAAPGG